MVTTSGNTTGVPALNVPFVSSNGVIGLPWYRFLINLWNRTGGSSSNIFYLNVPPTAPGQIPIYDGTFWDARPIAGDAILAADGHLTVVSTDGLPFAPSATVDTTDANNITSGILGSAFGGTGVDNGSSTVTLGGPFTTTGAHSLDITLTGATAVTFPTSGTLTTITSTTYTATTVAIAATPGIQIAAINNTAATAINLPATPVLGQIVIVQDASLNAATYNRTINGNGNNINLPTGAAASYVIGSNSGSVSLNWNGTAWGIFA